MRCVSKLSIYLLVLVFLSCAEDDYNYTESMPIVPDDLGIDINDDGILDYEISYDQVIYESTVSDLGIIGRLIPHGGNETLFKTGAEPLFLRNIAEISKSVADPLFWENRTYGKTIVSIQNNVKNEWPTEWDVASDSAQDSYLVGLKMKSNSENLLAWCEIKINTATGIVSVINKGFK